MDKMVMIRKYLAPHPDAIRLLQAPTSRLEVLELTSSFSTSMSYVLMLDAKPVHILSDYLDVRFKFEVFGLDFVVPTSEQERAARNIASYDSPLAFSFLFRHEWERPAASGEVPANREPIIRRRGKKADIPQDAAAVGVSLVGVSWNLLSDSRIGGWICYSDDDPFQLEYHDGATGLESLDVECDTVSACRWEEWGSSVGQWIAADAGPGM
ncbi:hypothetical protein SFA35_16815 [Pseudomonas sp. HR96]|uniref:hypothetical protein n=1 Tax=Pseudomonas sp. HR96 TaxID=1027966 RepID=UPI002A74F4B3|nr:hypothetical protein [Pseudomonas sp. HR96]WPO98301.1 hypothetical protein SFA35_16815 [Pseudomonas sp. HR96]